MIATILIATILIATPILWTIFRLSSDSHRRSQFYDMLWRQAGGLWLNTRNGSVTYGDGRLFFAPNSQDPAAFFPVRTIVSHPNYLREQHKRAEACESALKEGPRYRALYDDIVRKRREKEAQFLAEQEHPIP